MQLQSRFYWDSSNYSLTIHYPPSNLLEISINEGFALSTMFRALVSRVINTSNHSKYGCCYFKMNDDANKNPSIHEHDKYSACCSHQSTFASSKDDITSELFDIGETLFFTNNGWSGMVKEKSFSLDKTNVLRIVLTNSNGDDITTTKEYLCLPSNPDVGWIPSFVPEYKQSAKTLSEEDINSLGAKSVLVHSPPPFSLDERPF